MNKFKIYFMVAIPIIVVYLLMFFSGSMAMISSYGYGVDSYGRLYLGKNSKIEVYENDEIKYTLSSMTSRGYMFTVQSDDTIILSTAEFVYILDLDGNVISKKEDYRSRVYRSIEYNISSINHNNVIKSPWGRTEIVSTINGKVLYRMPLSEYIIILLLTFILVSVLIFVPIVIYNLWKK